jgi:hypothetical protein
MANHSAMKLGKRAPRFDERTLQLSKYLGAALAPAPPSADWTSGVTAWGMMLNDQLGDCTIAACGHAVQVWTAATGPMDTTSDEVVLQYYESWDGYNPTDPSTDQGGVELDVLNHWRASGFNDQLLTAYADPAPGNVEHIKQSIALFGGVYIGLAMPTSAQTQDIWDDVGDTAGSWGGHAVFVCAYDDNYLTCITWGQLKKMTWRFWAAYCDEAHTLLSATWLDRAPADFNLSQLVEDLTQVVG